MTVLERSSPASHVIHPSLYRPVLLAGAEPGFVIFEVSVIFALIFLVGLHLVTVVLALFYGTVFHSLVVWLSSQDAQISALYLRSLGYRDYYPATSSVHARSLAVRPSVPRAR